MPATGFRGLKRPARGTSRPDRDAEAAEDLLKKLSAIGPSRRGGDIIVPPRTIFLPISLSPPRKALNHRIVNRAAAASGAIGRTQCEDHAPHLCGNARRRSESRSRTNRHSPGEYDVRPPLPGVTARHGRDARISRRARGELGQRSTSVNCTRRFGRGRHRRRARRPTATRSASSRSRSR